LTAKSGVTLGREINIAFTTAGVAPSPGKSETGQTAQINANQAQPVKEAGQTNSSVTDKTSSPSQPAALSSTSTGNEASKEQAPVEKEEAGSVATSSPKENPEDNNDTIKTENEPENAVQNVSPTEDDKASQNPNNESERQQIPSLVLGLIAAGVAVAAGYLYHKKKQIIKFTKLCAAFVSVRGEYNG